MLGLKQKWNYSGSVLVLQRQDVGSMQVQGGVLGDIVVESQFVGYDQLETNSTVVAIIRNGELVDEAFSGDEVQLILDVTPFMQKAAGKLQTAVSFRQQMFRLA